MTIRRTPTVRCRGPGTQYIKEATHHPHSVEPVRVLGVWLLCDLCDHHLRSLTCTAALRAVRLRRSRSHPHFVRPRSGTAQPHYTCTLELPSLWLGGGNHGGTPSHTPGFPRGFPRTPILTPSGPTRGLWPATRDHNNDGAGSNPTRNSNRQDRTTPQQQPASAENSEPSLRYVLVLLVRC
jgi:hypothetical protein